MAYSSVHSMMIPKLAPPVSPEWVNMHPFKTPWGTTNPFCVPPAVRSTMIGAAGVVVVLIGVGIGITTFDATVVTPTTVKAP